MRLAVLGSTNGTDLVTIVKAINSGELFASIEVVVSNNESSGILRKAKGYGIENHFICHKNKKRGVFDFEISQILENKDVDCGPILLQKSCPVYENDSVESLRERVQKLEGESFIEVINNWRSYE